jgi:hypothetical protein
MANIPTVDIVSAGQRIVGRVKNGRVELACEAYDPFTIIVFNEGEEFRIDILHQGPGPIRTMLWRT